MLGLAIWLTFGGAGAWATQVARHLAEGGRLWHWLGEWLQLNLTGSVVHGAALLSWLDAAATSLEVTLLLLGHAWGEWLVVAGIGVLIPAEVVWIIRHATWGRLGVLAVNAAVLAYLLRRRLRPAVR